MTLIFTQIFVPSFNIWFRWYEYSIFMTEDFLLTFIVSIFFSYWLYRTAFQKPGIISLFWGLGGIFVLNILEGINILIDSFSSIFHLYAFFLTTAGNICFLIISIKLVSLNRKRQLELLPHHFKRNLVQLRKADSTAGLNRLFSDSMSRWPQYEYFLSWFFKIRYKELE